MRAVICMSQARAGQQGLRNPTPRRGGPHRRQQPGRRAAKRSIGCSRTKGWSCCRLSIIPPSSPGKGRSGWRSSSRRLMSRRCWCRFREAGWQPASPQPSKAIKPSTRVIGVSMERGAAMKASLDAGRPVPVEELPTLADSLGGGIGLDNRLTFAMCRDLLDDVVLLSEDEIAAGIRHAYEREREIVEGRRRRRHRRIARRQGQRGRADRGRTFGAQYRHGTASKNCHRRAGSGSATHDQHDHPHRGRTAKDREARSRGRRMRGERLPGAGDACPSRCRRSSGSTSPNIAARST